MEEKKIQIVLADDHPMFLSGVKAELETCDENKIIGITNDGSEALKMILELKPDVAILDYQMPGLTGYNIFVEAQKQGSQTAIMILTMYKEKKIFYKLIDEGILGYVLKDEAVENIIEAVKTISEGGTFISSSMTGLLMEKARNLRSNENSDYETILSTAEKKIIKHLLELKTNDEISEILFVSKRTIENQKTKLANKLGLEGSKQLLKYLLENKESFCKLS